MHRLAVFALAVSIAAAMTAACSGADMSTGDQPTSSASPISDQPPGPGVPLTLAEERARRVSDVRYALHFSVPAARDAPVSGTLTLRFSLTDPARPLALDFAGPADSVTSVRAGGQAVEPLVRDEHVVLPASALRSGENEITLAFTSSDLALNRSAEFMYTLFVPARARLAFPCFDQPDLKARYTLTLDIPAAWEVVANGAETRREVDGDRTTVAFAETRPLPTYLVAFAAGRFSVETAERRGRRFRMLHRETDAAKVARNRNTVFDLHASALEWLERYTGIPYPFEKFDFLLVPSFQFGGMEHPGAIFYNAPALLLDPSATQNQKLGRASLIAHETAHMWFGDLVTMRWFNDVWMKEVFANFMAAKIVNPAFPEINHELRFLYSHYPAAYSVDRTAGTNAIRQRLDNLNDAGSLYGAIIYQKAPIVMRQLEMIVSEDGLRDGLRRYLTDHTFANATWSDLIAILDGPTPDDLAAWSRAWVEEAGRPIVEVRLKDDADRSLTLVQRDPETERGLVWSQRLKVLVAYPRKTESHAIAASTPVTEVQAFQRAAQDPVFVLPTGGGIGYGDFVLDARSRAYLLAHLADVPDPLTRGAALVTLWEEMLDARITPSGMYDTLVAALPREADELTVQRLLSYTQHLFWTFLQPEEREARAPALETLLRSGLAAAKGASLKAAWFNALRDTARTPGTTGWLERVWRKKEIVPGLTLAEPDYITLALELAVREVPGWKRILDEQLARIQNPDRKAQFEFVMPALSADAAIRNTFFERLRDVANRRRETWVLQGVGYLHHPLRAADAERYIDPSLELLLEIQRTGDIFFPKRWMDATLSGHRSASAAHKVRSFVEKLSQDYPERLRRIVLSSADDLFRASRARER
ncbi:MAG: M1 family metallopeptidase [Vicinamibacterales bacterium]